jgi:excisionase family DNA binding protein
MKVRFERRTLTVPEAAKLLGIGRNQAYEATRRGEIPTIRIGKRLLVPLIALERMLQDQSEPGEEREAGLAGGRFAEAKLHQA